MNQIRTGQVDMSTGEIFEGGQLAVIFPKRKNGFQVGGWVAMAQGPMMELAKANVGLEAMRVMFALVANLDFENWINLNQAQLASTLGMDRQNFGRALKRLIAEDVILQGPKVGRNGTYRLNPSYGWKGSAKGHNAALQARMQARGISVVNRDGR
jgi:hypothetical protein